MTENHQFDSHFQRSDPVTPASDPPDVHELHHRVRKRRRRRKTIATLIVGGTMICTFALFLAGPNVGSDPSTIPGGANVHNDPALPTESLVSSEPSGVRVFATLWRQVPIFGLEEKTQYLRHVGWVDSEEMVPVDLSQFPSEQQESIEAVLYENDTDKYFNL